MLKKRVKNVGSEKNILFCNENAVHWTKLLKPLGVSFDRTLDAVKREVGTKNFLVWDRSCDETIGSDYIRRCVLVDVYSYDSTAIRLPLNCNSTALRPFDNLRYDRKHSYVGGLLHCDGNK